MIIEEKTGNLNLKLVGSPYPTEEDYEEALCCAFYLDERHNLIVESDAAPGHKFNNAKDFLNFMLKYRRVLCFGPQHQIEYFLRFFDFDALIKLYNHNMVNVDSYTIVRYSPSKISIRKGNTWCSIYDVSQFATMELNNLTLLTEFKDQLVKLSKNLGVSLNISTTSTSNRSLLSNFSDNLQEEMYRVKGLSKEKIAFIRSTVHGTWMSPTMLGTAGSVENLDHHKAHLRALKHIPSISSRNSVVKYNKVRLPEALMGFYLAEFNQPNIKEIGLITTRHRGKAISFSGSRIQYIAMPILDQLKEIGVEPKIHESIQFVPIRKPTYPYAPFSDIWEKLINGWSHEYDLIDLKMLAYKSLIGSMLHVHPKDTKKEFKTYQEVLNREYESHRMFNPMVASTIYSMVNVGVYNQLLKCKNPLYRRHDGISRVEGDGEIADHFRVETKGDVFIYNSVIHDNPGQDFWRGLAEDQPNQAVLGYIRDTYYGLNLSNLNPNAIGRRLKFRRMLYPDPDNMLLKKRIKSNRQLTEGSIKVYLPNEEQVPLLYKGEE